MNYKTGVEGLRIPQFAPPAPLFTLADAERAAEEWGFNCGPAAVAVMTGLMIEELRPHLGGFERKRYTNPTLMREILKNIGAKCVSSSVSGFLNSRARWPEYGLARVQWEGPWTAPGVPIAARYRHTHWVGAMRVGRERGIFDVNCLNSGGWVSLADWSRTMVPYILRECHPKANGEWHLTHSIEIQRARRRQPSAVGQGVSTTETQSHGEEYV